MTPRRRGLASRRVRAAARTLLIREDWVRDIFGFRMIRFIRILSLCLVDNAMDCFCRLWTNPRDLLELARRSIETGPNGSKVSQKPFCPVVANAGQAFQNVQLPRFSSLRFCMPIWRIVGIAQTNQLLTYVDNQAGSLPDAKGTKYWNVENQAQRDQCTLERASRNVHV